MKFCLVFEWNLLLYSFWRRTSNNLRSKFSTPTNKLYANNFALKILLITRFVNVMIRIYGDV